MTNMSGTFLNSDAGPQGEGKDSPSNTGSMHTASNEKYLPYPEYKESVLDWLGKIPVEWNLLALKHALQTSVTDGPHETPLFVDEGIPFMSVDSIQNNKLSFEGCRFISEEDHNRYSKKCSPQQGDILLGKAASVGKVAHVTTDAVFNVWSPLAVIRINKNKHNSRFFYYCIQSMPIQYQCKIKSNSNTQANLGMGDISNLVFVIPPATTQNTIAAFLDYETARIDQLIAKQQQLIELLKEKRQAVISHAVTKGLNPHASLKDSGVEWLGQVPEHWVVCQFKFITTLMQTGPFGSQLHAEDYIEGGVPLINPAHMLEGKLVPDMRASVDIDTQERLSRHKLVVGDLILARRGELGRCAVVKEENQGWLCGTGSLKVTLSSNMLSDYCYQLINSDGVRAELSLESKGSTMDNLNAEVLGKVRVPFPPIEEQTQILSYIQLIQDRFTSLFTRAAKQIVLLQERRTALISAAVTGKIDLRGWQPPQREVAA